MINGISIEVSPYHLKIVETLIIFLIDQKYQAIRQQ